MHYMEIEMGGNTDINVRKAVGLLTAAILAAQGPEYTGQIVIRLNVHKGTAGKVTAQSEEVIEPIAI